MGILITASLLLVAAGALAVLRAARPGFRYSWLLALAATVAAWLMALLMRIQLPINLDIPLWESSVSAASYATFTVNATSWPYILGMVSIALTLILLAPGRPRFPAPASWAICLALAGLGVLALSADSPLTLVLFWAAIDLVEAGLLLARLEDGSKSNQVSFAFAVRLLSIGVVLLASVVGDPGSAGAKFSAIQAPFALALLPAAALLRLTAFAVPWPKDTLVGPDDVGLMLQLTAGAASVSFLSQLTAFPSGFALPLICVLSSFYAGYMYLRAPEIHQARPLWIMGVGTLAVAASLLGNPLGAAAWCSAILLVGAPTFANTLADIWARRGLLIGLWIASALPFSLTATSWSTTGGNWLLIVAALLVGQAMLLAGMFHGSIRPPIGSAVRLEVMALKAVQYTAIGLPLALGVALGLWGWPGAFQIGAPLAGLLLIPLAVGLAWAKPRLRLLSPAPTDWIPKWMSAARVVIGREGSRIGGSLQRLAEATTRTMEGEAGMMWAFLFLVLFVSLISGGKR